MRFQRHRADPGLIASALRGARMSGNKNEADDQFATGGTSNVDASHTLAEALRALEPEIEKELASLDDALGELRDAAAIERDSTMATKPVPPPPTIRQQPTMAPTQGASRVGTAGNGKQARLDPVGSPHGPARPQFRFDQPPPKPFQTAVLKEAEPVKAAAPKVRLAPQE